MPSKRKKLVPPDVYDKNRKAISATSASTDGKLQAWHFDMLDNDGYFCLNMNRVCDDQCRYILEKIMLYSSRTWAEIKKETHDKNSRTKHHLLDYDALSEAAKARFKAKKFDDLQYEDSIYSMSLANKLRIIGIRMGAEFHAVWLDPDHEFCPSTRR